MSSKPILGYMFWGQWRIQDGCEKSGNMMKVILWWVLLHPKRRSRIPEPSVGLPRKEHSLKMTNSIKSRNTRWAPVPPRHKACAQQAGHRCSGETQLVPNSFYSILSCSQKLRRDSLEFLEAFPWILRICHTKKYFLEAIKTFFLLKTFSSVLPCLCLNV